jgi:hypothetical protein
MNKKILQDSSVTFNLSDLRRLPKRTLNPIACISITTFQPKQYQKYYFIEEGFDTNIKERCYSYTLQDLINVHFRNCFKTKKDAKKVLKSIDIL